VPVVALDHLQVAMPAGSEAQARRFYGQLLGLREIDKPAATAGRGGVWFLLGPGQQLHLGVEADFRPARKAHPAFVVDGYRELLQQLRIAGFEVTEDSALPGVTRAFAADPFGNRVELIASDLTSAG
jgi:catechol 2,3-dioxygenase-like lactoylglutathione lyase family enzyme